MIQEALDRIESDAPNRLAARRALCALALARNGLTERELMVALRLPLAYWAPLRNALASYLVTPHVSAVGSGQLTSDDDAQPLSFFCTALRFAVCERFEAAVAADEAPVLATAGRLGGRGAAVRSSRSAFASTSSVSMFDSGSGGMGESEDAVKPAALHSELADYFLAQYKKGRRVARAVRELPYHLCEGERASEAAELLCDLAFIEAKCAAGAAGDLLDDFGRTHAALAARPVKLLGGNTALGRSASSHSSKRSPIDDVPLTDRMKVYIHYCSFFFFFLISNKQKFCLLYKTEL